MDSLTRLKMLFGVAVLVAGILVWRWVAGWGLVTVNFVEAPLGKVIAAVQRQGGVRIATNADRNCSALFSTVHRL